MRRGQTASLDQVHPLGILLALLTTSRRCQPLKFITSLNILRSSLVSKATSPPLYFFLNYATNFCSRLSGEIPGIRTNFQDHFPVPRIEKLEAPTTLQVPRVELAPSPLEISTRSNMFCIVLQPCVLHLEMALSRSHFPS